MFTTDALAAALAGRYAIERLVGEGGMAKVYLARDLRHNRKVALKVLRPDLGAVVGVDRFQSEIEDPRVSPDGLAPHSPRHRAGRSPDSISASPR